MPLPLGMWHVGRHVSTLLDLSNSIACQEAKTWIPYQHHRPWLRHVLAGMSRIKESILPRRILNQEKQSCAHQCLSATLLLRFSNLLCGLALVGNRHCAPIVKDNMGMVHQVAGQQGQDDGEVEGEEGLPPPQPHHHARCCVACKSKGEEGRACARMHNDAVQVELGKVEDEEGSPSLQAHNHAHYSIACKNKGEEGRGENAE
eukprot:533376-Pelagomonas_calceolata.AAC.5